MAPGRCSFGHFVLHAEDTNIKSDVLPHHDRINVEVLDYYEYSLHKYEKTHAEL